MPSVPAPDLGNGRHRPGPYPAASATLVRRRLPGHHPHAGLLGVAATAPARARPLQVRLASPTSRPGCSAPTTASAPSTCPTTSTNSSSASTDAAPPWRRSNPCWARPSGTPRPPTRCCMLLSQPDRHYGDYPVGGGYSSSNWRPAPPSEGRIVPKRCLGMPNLCGATRWAKRYCTQISAAGPWAPEGPWPMGVRRASS